MWQKKVWLTIDEEASFKITEFQYGPLRGKWAGEWKGSHKINENYKQEFSANLQHIGSQVTGHFTLGMARLISGAGSDVRPSIKEGVYKVKENRFTCRIDVENRSYQLSGVLSKVNSKTTLTGSWKGSNEEGAFDLTQVE